MVVRRFEWDSAKERFNLRKHGLDFTQATLVFHDPFVVSTPDFGEHGETRWKAFGQIHGLTLVVVVHTLWETNDDGQPVEVVRIISARKITRQERKQYETENG